MLAECEIRKAKWQTYKMVDGGEAIEIERSGWI